MNKKTILMLCIVLSIFILNNITFANEKIEDCKYSKNIIVNGENKYKSIFLDQEIYKYSKESLSDIRIIDNDGNFVPYYLSDGTSNLHKDFFEYRFNRKNKFKKDDDTFFDFEEAVHKFGMDNLTNELKFYVDKNEFLIDIVVYGGFDGANWEYVTTDRIYKIENLSKASVGFNDVKRYSHYRVKVLNNIENIELQYLIGEYDYNKVIQRRYEKNIHLEYDIKTESKVTYITINNENNLKISNINLEIDGIFKRNYGINVKSDDSFVSIGNSGLIYNLEFKHLNVEDTNVSFNNPIPDDIQIKIYNYDDAPLNVNDINVSYSVDKLVFEAKEGKQYKLYFGNENVKKPKYDIEEYSSHIEAEIQDECSFGELETHKSNVKIQKEYDFKIIFNVVMIMVSVILVVFIGMKIKAKTE